MLRGSSCGLSPSFSRSRGDRACRQRAGLQAGPEAQSWPRNAAPQHISPLMFKPIPGQLFSGKGSVVQREHNELAEINSRLVADNTRSCRAQGTARSPGIRLPGAGHSPPPARKWVLKPAGSDSSPLLLGQPPWPSPRGLACWGENTVETSHGDGIQALDLPT